MKYNHVSFSVIMSVYGKDDISYFNVAMKSIWDDQILKPDKIVLVRDGPVSEALEKMIKTWEKKLGLYLNVIRNEFNLGLAHCLNIAIDNCETEYVARMDSDDVSLPDRFDKQIKFISAHNKVDVLGGNIIETDFSNFEKLITYPQGFENIFKYSKKRSPHAHVTVMMKLTSLKSIGGYPSYYPEDYPLWIKFLMNNKICENINTPLVKVRMNENMINRRGRKFLYGILEITLYQRRVKHINFMQFFFNIIYRLVIHNLPTVVRKQLYKMR